MDLIHRMTLEHPLWFWNRLTRNLMIFFGGAKSTGWSNNLLWFFDKADQQTSMVFNGANPQVVPKTQIWTCSTNTAIHLRCHSDCRGPIPSAYPCGATRRCARTARNLFGQVRADVARRVVLTKLGALYLYPWDCYRVYTLRTAHCIQICIILAINIHIHIFMLFLRKENVKMVTQCLLQIAASTLCCIHEIYRPTTRFKWWAPYRVDLIIHPKLISCFFRSSPTKHPQCFTNNLSRSLSYQCLYYTWECTSFQRRHRNTRHFNCPPLIPIFTSHRITRHHQNNRF